MSFKLATTQICVLVVMFWWHARTLLTMSEGDAMCTTLDIFSNLSNKFHFWCSPQQHSRQAYTLSPVWEILSRNRIPMVQQEWLGMALSSPNQNKSNYQRMEWNGMKWNECFQFCQCVRMASILDYSWIQMYSLSDTLIPCMRNGWSRPALFHEQIRRDFLPVRWQ